MCRKKQMQGWCAVCFGLGLLVGKTLESTLLCSAGGIVMILFGLMLAKK